MACALSAAGAANAAPKPRHPGAKASLESEVQQLKAQVESLQKTVYAQSEALRSAQTQMQSNIAASRRDADEATARARALQARLDQQIQQIPGAVQTAVAAQPKPSLDRLPYKGVSLTMGGFAAAETATRSHDQTADIGSSFAKIPYANDRAGHTSSTNFTGRQSRYSLLVQGNVTPAIHASFYGEFDFLGAAQTANSNESNSYQPRIRHIYGALDWDAPGWHLLAGQNWSLATMNASGITPRNEYIPLTIDAQYAVGFVWARQPQVRIVKDFDKKVWLALSLENPQTTFGNVAVASGVTLTNNQAPAGQFFSGTNYSLNDIPDIIGKAAIEQDLDGHHLHAELFGIYRSYLSRVTIAPTATNQAGLLGLTAGTQSVRSDGGGVGGGVVLGAIPKLLDLQASFLAGEGIGRYGTSQFPDVAAQPDGTLKPISETFWLAGATWHATPMLDLYVYGGEEDARSKVFRPAALPGVAFGYGTLPGSNNAGCAVEGGACSAVTRSLQQIDFGLWDKIYQGAFGSVRFGLQYSHTEKRAFADAATGFAPKATEDMLFTSFRYYPF